MPFRAKPRWLLRIAALRVQPWFTRLISPRDQWQIRAIDADGRFNPVFSCTVGVRDAGKFEEVCQQRPALLSEDGLGMELDTIHWPVAVVHGHRNPIHGSRRHNQFFRQGRFFYDLGVIASCAQRIRQARE